MSELNDHLDELKDEVNGLRNDLEDLEDTVGAIVKRLEEELDRANKVRLSLWAQSDDGKNICVSNSSGTRSCLCVK